MIRSAVTVSLVEEARGGPFVFWDGLADAFRSAEQLGFDAVEIFAPAADAVDRAELNTLLDETGLCVAAVGTGAGMVKHGLSLTDADASQRQLARDFVRSIIDFGGPYQAPAIIGSMQGRWNATVSREQALQWLAEACGELGTHAAQYGVPLICEPINRYETNLVRSFSEGLTFLEQVASEDVKLLADLFHMNIEDVDVAASIRAAGERVGHVHFVDSNRRPAGCGHLDFGPIAASLKAIQYDGFASAEALPFPNSQAAAEQTMTAFRKYFR